MSERERENQEDKNKKRWTDRGQTETPTDGQTEVDQKRIRQPAKDRQRQTDGQRLTQRERIRQRQTQTDRWTDGG